MLPIWCADRWPQRPSPWTGMVGWLREQAAGSAAAAAGGGRLYRFRESLFLLPAIVVLAGVALAEVCAAVDPAAGPGSVVPLTLDINSNAATWLLSTVAGATITTAGVVSSLTVVNLQPASSQSSPRVMRLFIRDRVSQRDIGLLVPTVATAC